MVKIVDFIINNQKHQIDKQVRRQDHYFSTRLADASKKIREIFYSMLNTTYITRGDMITKIQKLKGKTKLKFYQNISNYYNEMKYKNFQFEQDLFAKIAQDVSKKLS